MRARTRARACVGWIHGQSKRWGRETEEEGGRKREAAVQCRVELDTGSGIQTTLFFLILFLVLFCFLRRLPACPPAAVCPPSAPPLSLGASQPANQPANPHAAHTHQSIVHCPPPTTDLPTNLLPHHLASPSSALSSALSSAPSSARRPPPAAVPRMLVRVVPCSRCRTLKPSSPRPPRRRRSPPNPHALESSSRTRARVDR